MSLGSRNIERPLAPGSTALFRCTISDRKTILPPKQSSGCLVCLKAPIKNQFKLKTSLKVRVMALFRVAVYEGL